MEHPGPVVVALVGKKKVLKKGHLSHYGQAWAWSQWKARLVLQPLRSAENRESRYR